MAEDLNLSISSRADHKKLDDFITKPVQNRYVVEPASDGYIISLRDLAERLNANIASLENRYPLDTNDPGDYDVSRDLRSRCEAQLEEVNQALEIMTSDDPIDITDRLSQEYDHVLWLEAIEVYQEKIKIYKSALESIPYLPLHIVRSYVMAIEQLNNRIAKLKEFLEQYEATLQVLGKGALGETSLRKPTPDKVSV
mgnify:CR=1 FL=1